MRELSAVATRRKKSAELSRELHDHVAQVRLASGWASAASSGSADPRVSAGLTEAGARRRHVPHRPRPSARLRPSMLDDFGLQAALEWHVRDFTRRYAIDVELKTAEISRLSDKHRTAVTASSRGDDHCAPRRRGPSASTSAPWTVSCACWWWTTASGSIRRCRDRNRPARHRRAGQGAARHDDHQPAA